MTFNKYEVRQNPNGRSNGGISLRDAPTRDDYPDTTNTADLMPGDQFVAHESVADGFSDRVTVVEEDVEVPMGNLSENEESTFVRPRIEKADENEQVAARRSKQSSTANYGEDVDAEARREGEADSNSNSNEGESGN